MIHTLIGEVARIVVEAEAGIVIDGCNGPPGRNRIEGDFGRMDFQSEVHANLVENI